MPQVIAMDSMPQTRNGRQCRDHSAMQLFGLTHAPLFAPGVARGVPACASRITSSADGTHHRIVLKRGRGSAAAFAASIRDVQHGQPCPEQFWLRQVVDMRVEGGELLLSTARPHRRLAEVLSMLSLSPECGRFRLRDWRDDEIALVANPEWARTRPDIRMVRVKDPRDNVQHFLEGRLDITSDTAFPLDLVHSYLHDPRLRVTTTGIFALLSFEGELATPEAVSRRRAIAAAIDQDQLVGRLAGVYRATSDLVPEEDPRARMMGTVHSGIDAPSYEGTGALRLMYDDYYPNQQVCAVIAEQLSRAGINVELVADCYEARSAQGELRLTLTRGLRSGPLALYHSFLFDPILRAHREHLRAYLDVLDRDETCAEAPRDTVAVLQGVLDDLGVVAPLFEIPGVFLSNTAQAPWAWEDANAL